MTKAGSLPYGMVLLSMPSAVLRSHLTSCKASQATSRVAYTPAYGFCNPTMQDLPCCASIFPDIPFPLPRGVFRFAISRTAYLPWPSLVRQKLGSPCRTLTGLQDSFVILRTASLQPIAGHSSASTHTVTRMRWDLANRDSGVSRSRTFTE